MERGAQPLVAAGRQPYVYDGQVRPVLVVRGEQTGRGVHGGDDRVAGVGEHVPAANSTDTPLSARTPALPG